MIVGFAKYEGTGNDFIIIDARTFEFEFTPEFIASLCDRNRGIGADGFIVIGLARGKTDFDARCFNSFGFEKGLCGNGGRCVALFAHHEGIGGREKIFSGVDGLHRAKVTRPDDLRGDVEFLLGRPTATVRHHKEDRYLMDVGSLQCVVFVHDIEAVDALTDGRIISADSDYGRKGVCVNFVEIAGEGKFRIRSYSYATDNELNSSSSGALAAALLTRAIRQPECRDFRIMTEGGPLRLSLVEDGRGDITEVWLRGEGRKVFQGRFETDNFPIII